jgi:hypothetical protein
MGENFGADRSRWSRLSLSMNPQRWRWSRDYQERSDLIFQHKLISGCFVGMDNPHADAWG